MRKTLERATEKCRVKEGPYASSRYDGNNGMFHIPILLDLQPIRGHTSGTLVCIVSDGSYLDDAIKAGRLPEGTLPWEHVSVSLKLRGPVAELPLVESGRCPTWNEMCLVKDTFWEPDEVVVQYHPRASEYRNFHPFCLHLWRPLLVDLPTPDPYMVAPANR